MYSITLFIVDLSFSGVQRVGLHAHRDRRQQRACLEVGDAPGEPDVPLDAELARQRVQRRRRVAAADQHREEVVPPQRHDDLAHGAQPVVDAVLRTHRADVADQVARPRGHGRIGRQRAEALRRTVAHDEHALRAACARVPAPPRGTTRWSR
jgi:hypothetical protein